MTLKSYMQQVNGLPVNKGNYRIARNLQGRKLLRIGEKYDFLRRKLSRIVTFAAPKDATLSNFTEKTFANSHKNAKFVKVFSLESFPLYSSLHLD